MRGWLIGASCGFFIAGCVDEPTGLPGTLLETPRPSAAIVYGPVLTLNNITELQPLPGATDITPADVNRVGQVVGTSGGRPVIWERGVPTELLVPAGWEGVAPNSISDDGRVVGLIGSFFEGHRALMWVDGSAEEFNPFPARENTWARINHTGVIVGMSGPGRGDVAFVWDDGVATVVAPAEGYDRAEAHFANATGMVLGTSEDVYSDEDPDELVHFTIWRDGRVLDVVEGRPAPPEEWLSGISDAGDAFFYNTDGGWALYRWRDGFVEEFPAGEPQGQDRVVHEVAPDGTLLMTWEGDWGVWMANAFRPLDDGIVSDCAGLAGDGWLVCRGPGREHPFVAQLDLEPSGAPRVLDLAVDGITASSVTLGWTQIDDGTGSPARYRLKYGAPPIDYKTATIGCDRTIRGTEIGAPISCTVEGLDAQTAYEFQLMSFRVEDGVWVNAQYSNRAATTTGADRVTDLRHQSSVFTEINVEWTQVDDGTGNPARYRVKYSEPPIDYATATRACTIQGDEIGARLSCRIGGLEPGTYYDFQLMSYRVEDGVWVDAKESNVVQARTSGAAPNAAVNDLRVSGRDFQEGTGSLFLQWTEVDDGSGSPASYRLRYGSPLDRWRDGALGCNQTGANVGSSIACWVEGLTPGVRYEFQLLSYGVDENGAWVNARYSNEVSATAPTQ